MARWRGGAVARWRGGAVARWRGGAVARWSGGAVGQWRGGAVGQWRGGAVAQRCSGASASRLRTRVRILRCRSNLGKVRSFYFDPVYLVHEYMAIDSGGYLCTNILRALIAAWLEVSQRSRDGARLNMYAGE